MSRKNHIVILGGGYAGVTTAVGLLGMEAKVTPVNNHSYHYLTTLLHLLVVGQREYTDLSLSLRDVLPKPIKFLRGRVLKIIPNENRVEIRTRKCTQQVTYDILVTGLVWQP